MLTDKFIDVITDLKKCESTGAAGHKEASAATAAATLKWKVKNRQTVKVALEMSFVGAR